MIPDGVQKYLRSRGVFGPWRIEGCPDKKFGAVVVIPALAEGEALFATLQSLAANPRPSSDFLALAVVNNRLDAADEERKTNASDLALLRKSGGRLNGMALAWIDASSPGLELPTKTGGVGLARKIGFDLALERLLYTEAHAPLLASLDADTLVDNRYVSALYQHFCHAAEGGAVLPFRHQRAANALQQQAIDLYELYLHHHALGLKLAKSPYAFPTVGSAMAFTAEAYCRIGGMNRRQAGEDFYFLQQMAKTFGVAPLRGTEVRPSARISHRTPFGTGPTVSRFVSGDKSAVRFYHPDCYRVLGAWLSLALVSRGQSGREVLERAEGLSPSLAAFLNHVGLTDTWERLRRQHRHPEAFSRAFHGWFDGLKSLQLIHHLSATSFPRVSAEQALPALMRQVGLPVPERIDEILEVLRNYRND